MSIRAWADDPDGHDGFQVPPFFVASKLSGAAREHTPSTNRLGLEHVKKGEVANDFFHPSTLPQKKHGSAPLKLPWRGWTHPNCRGIMVHCCHGNENFNVVLSKRMPGSIATASDGLIIVHSIVLEASVCSEASMFGKTHRKKNVRFFLGWVSAGLFLHKKKQKKTHSQN